MLELVEFSEFPLSQWRVLTRSDSRGIALIFCKIAKEIDEHVVQHGEGSEDEAYETSENESTSKPITQAFAVRVLEEQTAYLPLVIKDKIKYAVLQVPL